MHFHLKKKKKKKLVALNNKLQLIKCGNNKIMHLVRHFVIFINYSFLIKTLVGVKCLLFKVMFILALMRLIQNVFS